LAVEPAIARVPLAQEIADALLELPPLAAELVDPLELLDVLLLLPQALRTAAARSAAPVAAPYRWSFTREGPFREYLPVSVLPDTSRREPRHVLTRPNVSSGDEALSGTR
jgi:hypothetical protein